ncbi:hypothetical protein NP590_14410 [Methylomonas sp. SURF-2]|uniref:Uncharacterized protein n=1 Tax=Methylomonas subterranea TaxID=2952225 RepID=A0ABT1TKN5_9GAMM|nr:hypothetical protein [Methylomonas sp. SURF-2]MCQ8105304.1 hypothetical protein [Methylomonas sp. SURF-2]
MTGRKVVKKVNKDRIYRAVASSSAIETGESVKVVEQKLKSSENKFRYLALAD